ncbi:MAG: type II toxin-antitoxin system VapC family toxin [Comamonadaceae bacterium]|nr:MAG: type II toxin-antitoxin system VapC family toxin [Comamonadaceae bacterium]
MYVLDTNVISELRSGKPAPSAAVRGWAEQQPANQLYLSAITTMELDIGVRRMERRDAEQGAILRRWSEAIVHQFGGRILPFTASTSLFCAAMHVPDPRSFRDSMIAATAFEHGFTVVTRNVSDFADTGAKLFNPWN